MAIRNFFIGILFAFVCGFFAIAHAEEVDSYFVCEIKNVEDHQPYKLLFESMTRDNKNGVVGMRDMIYWATIYGKYSETALDCEITEAQQKIAFGENLVELTAKLYLTADELDKAERKINFLSDNARDNSTKIRALNLKSDLYNRRGNYRGALTMTGEAAELLRSTSDEKFSLINQSRRARAYCGLGETQKSLELAEKIFPSMQNIFGKAGIETLALMSTLAEDYRKLQRYEDDQKILMNKLQAVNEHYGQNAPLLVAKTALELADASFATKDTKRGEEFSNFVLKLATQCADGSPFASLQLYSTLKETATKNLGDSHPLVLKAQLGIAQMNNVVGDIPQSIELCKKNLPKFKKVFGKQSDETLSLMKILSDDYILLGNYSNAKKIVDARLTVCKKKFRRTSRTHD